MRPKFLKLILFFLLLGTFSAQAQNKIKFVEYELENGLRVILHENHSAPLVAVTVMYHVGSKNENPQMTGFAHFFEHLLFEGSENIKRGEFSKYVENAGGILNANTTYDRTFYYELLPSNQLELGMWLESERMLHAKVEKIGIQTQKKVVREEANQRVNNTPYGSILQEITKRSYKVHPYRWTVLGDMEQLANARDEEFVNFYKTFYVPNNAVLSIAGDINIKDAKKLIAKYFANIPKGKREIYRPKITEPEQTSERRDTVFDNIQLPAVIHAYHIPAQGTPDFYAVNMLSTLLSQGKSSRLQRALVNEQQKAVFVGAFPLSLEDPGLSLSFAICNMNVAPEDAEKSIDAVYKEVRENLISENDFQKIRNQMESDFFTKNSSMATIAESLANYKLYFGDANLINTEIDHYMKVTREDIQRVAQKYFTESNRVALYYLPKQ